MASSAMETFIGQVVRFRGPGLNNTPALPNRARQLLGADWEEVTFSGEVVGVQRRGVLRVRLASGELVLVEPEFAIDEARDPEEGQEEPAGGGGAVLELGSDE